MPALSDGSDRRGRGRDRAPAIIPAGTLLALAEAVAGRSVEGEEALGLEEGQSGGGQAIEEGDDLASRDGPCGVGGLESAPASGL